MQARKLAYDILNSVYKDKGFVPGGENITFIQEYSV